MVSRMREQVLSSRSQRVDGLSSNERELGIASQPKRPFRAEKQSGGPWASRRSQCANDARHSPARHQRFRIVRCPASRIRVDAAGDGQCHAGRPALANDRQSALRDAGGAHAQSSHHEHGSTLAQREPSRLGEPRPNGRILMTPGFASATTVSRARGESKSSSQAPRRPASSGSQPTATKRSARAACSTLGAS